MIEIVDTTTEKTIGNALCFFVKDKNDTKALILDNIEINHAYRATAADKEVGIQLRTAITEYASNVAQEVTGQANVPIYLGKNYQLFYSLVRQLKCKIKSPLFFPVMTPL